MTYIARLDHATMQITPWEGVYWRVEFGFRTSCGVAADWYPTLEQAKRAASSEYKYRFKITKRIRWIKNA
jgi:hypothetical protein